MNNSLYQWWLTKLGRTIIWAGVRELPAGTAEIVDSDGNRLSYDSLDTALATLMDADYIAFDGMDEYDAAARGFRMDELQVPAINDENFDVDDLRAKLVQALKATVLS